MGAGSKNGGLTTVKKYGAAHMREIGSRGGKKTASRHGAAHMRKIGARGAARFYELYQLVPVNLTQFAIVCRKTGKVIAFQDGKYNHE